LPERFADQEHLDRYERDPLLRGQLRRIWNRGDLPEYERGIRMTRLVEQSDQKVYQSQMQAAYRQRLRQEGRLAEWADAVEADEQSAAASTEYATAVSRIMAAAYGVDPDDPGYVNAGRGNTPEEQVAHFAEWAERNSPRNRQFVDRRTAEVVADYEGRIATMQAEHEARIAELTGRLRDEGEAQATQREAQARGGLPAPPRAPAPAGSLGPPSWQQPTVNTIRANLAAGYRQHRGD
jgi:hypothetical protein